MERVNKKTEKITEVTEEHKIIPSQEDAVLELEKEKAALNEQITSLEQEKNSIAMQAEKKAQQETIEQERQKQLDMQKLEIEELRCKVAALQREREETQRIYIGGTAINNKAMPAQEINSVTDALSHYLNQIRRN